MVVPGQIMNLKGFKLQLPVAGPKAGSVEEILQPQLDSYSSIYFNASADNGVLFWCPENGAHTSGSTLPRSELREVLDFDLRAGGFHELNVTLAVIETTATKSITIGQAHFDGLSGSCSICVELEWNDGVINSHMRDSNCKTVKQTVSNNYQLGQMFSYTIRVIGNAVFVFTNSGSMKEPYPYSWLTTDTPLYFKAGNYLQDVGPSATIGSQVKIFKLATFHKIMM